MADRTRRASIPAVGAWSEPGSGRAASPFRCPQFWSKGELCFSSRRTGSAFLRVQKSGGLVIDLLHGCPEVILERIDDGLDVGVLDVRVFAMILIVIRVVSPVTPRLLELLANMLERVDHGARVVKALVRDMVVKVLLEGEVHLLEDVVPRDVSPRATAHGCRSVLAPHLANIGAHHVDSCGLLDGLRGLLVLVRGAEEWKKVAPRPVERRVAVAANRVTDREPWKEQLVDEPHNDTKNWYAHHAHHGFVWVVSSEVDVS